MGVSPNQVIQPDHFGSLFAMEDYKQTSHFMFLTINHMASEKLSLFGSLSYTKSKAELNQVIMPGVSTEVTTVLPHADFTFDQMHTYSDLDYTIISFNAGFEVRLAPTVSFTADGEYADFADDQPWVFGDETGSMFIIRSGIRIDL